MKPTDNNNKDQLSQEIEAKEKRKIKAQKGSKRSIWFGLGMIGLVGWSVAVPVLLGAGLGRWLDHTCPETFSWTLTCLTVGLFVGVGIVWYWVSNEDKEMHEDKDKNDE